MTLTQVRKYALSLPRVSEEPHFDRISFRVGGRIFLTARPAESHIHVFVPEEQREAALAIHPDLVSKLLWGGKVVGLRIELPRAPVGVVNDLIESAWEARTPGKSRIPARGPTTIVAYIRAAPREGQAHLRRLHALLKSVAPEAEETIKWGTPFFVEPRFLFAFSAHKAHFNFTLMESGMEPFREELKEYKTTKRLLQIPYDKPLPEDLIRRIARRRVEDVRKRTDDAFW